MNQEGGGENEDFGQWNMLPDFYNPEVSKLNFYVIENDKDD
jgi:hypothetical protein